MQQQLHLASFAAACSGVAGCSGSGAAGPGVQALSVDPAASAARAPPAAAPQIGPAPRLAVSDVSLGADHVCALASNGEVWCWGANYGKQILATSVDAYATPVRIPLPLAATGVAVSDSENCALLSDGQRACWGSSRELESGFEIESSPRFHRLVPALPANCGLTHAQELVCGGFNRFGVLGFPWDDQAKVEAELPQRAVPLPGRVEAVALAGDLGCALVGPERRLLCWGNGWGCNGPKPVELPAKVSALSGGGARVCLLTSDGDVYQFTELPSPRSPAPATCRDDEAARQPVTKVAEAATQVSCYAPLFSDCSMCSGCIIDRQQQVLCWHERPAGGVIVLDDAMSNSKTNAAARPRSVVVPTLVEGVSHPKRIAAGDGFYCAVMQSGLLQCWGSNNYGQLGRGHVSDLSDLEATPAEPAWPP